MTKINVLVVDDSAFMRMLITNLLSEDERIKVIGTARNGQDALDKIHRLKPDVVTLDVEMPIMNGIDALKRIMKETPLPVIMLSSTTKEGAENTLIAIQYGAFDFIPKPSGSISLDLHKVKDELVEKVIEAKSVNMKRLKLLETKKLPTPIQTPFHEETTKHNTLNRKNKKIVLIGTSTGGPRSLQEVLERLPSNLEAPVLIVQHMPPGFTKSLSERLDSVSSLHVKEAENGEVLRNGTCYIAPGGSHLQVKRIGNTVVAQVSQDPPVNAHRPSVDVLLESAIDLQDYEKIVVIMTGMGSDGARGLGKLKKSGNVYAIAESEETAVIFGMPKAAIQTGLVEKIVKLENIAEQIVKKVNMG